MAEKFDFIGRVRAFLNENANSRKDMSMGGLYDSVSGCGFSIKRKTSIMPDKNVNPDGSLLAPLSCFSVNKLTFLTVFHQSNISGVEVAGPNVA
ncbi:hypothetical protein JHK84_034403 [Glycine max]|nr:hypothetical protein JHK85_034777 [Glycine max]KAG4986448.1 hypothetical protein JHK86_034139 [Glycine max]KAG5140635.1 hypothetical protein JHK84_034403 [Glycine max]